MPSLSSKTIEQVIIGLADEWEPKFRSAWRKLMQKWIVSGELTDLLSDLARGHSVAEMLLRINALGLPAKELATVLADIQVMANFASISAYGFSVEAEARSFAEQFAASRVAETTNAARDGMRRVFLDGIDNGTTVDKLAKDLQHSLGLDTRYATALNNYAKALRANPGMSPGRINDLIDSYRYRLVAARSQTIARTEVMTALNRGHRLAYLTAYSHGLLDADDKIKWTTYVDEKTCPVCGALNGKTTTIGAAFASTQGPIYDPPAHPNCRCTTTLALHGR